MTLWPLLALILLTAGLFLAIGMAIGRDSSDPDYPDWPCCLRALQHLQEEHRG